MNEQEWKFKGTAEQLGVQSRRIAELEVENVRLKAELAAERRGYPTEQPLTYAPLDRQIVLLNRRLADAEARAEKAERSLAELKSIQAHNQYERDAAIKESNPR